MPSTARCVSELIGTRLTVKPSSVPSSSGLTSRSPPSGARARVNASSLTMIVAPRSISAEVGLQRRRVHRHQDVRRVARREDVARGEVDLERRDAADGAGGRADLGREVGQRREVVAEHSRRIGEPAAGELHAVAGVPREAHDDALARLACLRRRRASRAAGHRSRAPDRRLRSPPRATCKRPGARTWNGCPDPEGGERRQDRGGRPRLAARRSQQPQRPSPPQRDRGQRHGDEWQDDH